MLEIQSKKIYLEIYKKNLKGILEKYWFLQNNFHS